MSFPIQITISTTYVQPDHVIPFGGLTPWYVSDDDLANFLQLLYTWISEDKTDGIQYSDQVGVFIRRWSDEAASQAYLDHCLNTMFWPMGVPEDQVIITSVNLDNNG